ncbi:hypothetical protein B0H17DRAFT_1086692 [Mycena rosella]|uniref:Uncharacterized protein n=1 Tax=Mycena rosella TaxID=1033263 RepID=A0AAD7CY17_MYCRO|nr:hypothetical protein B0H17DRAFT_1086692 [Mycena rosella]
MFFTTLMLAFAAVGAVQAGVIGARQGDPPPVFTATRTYETTTDVYPYIVTATTFITWTQSPTTIIAQPTGPGI